MTSVDRSPRSVRAAERPRDPSGDSQGPRASGPTAGDRDPQRVPGWTHDPARRSASGLATGPQPVGSPVASPRDRGGGRLGFCRDLVSSRAPVRHGNRAPPRCADRPDGVDLGRCGHSLPRPGPPLPAATEDGGRGRPGVDCCGVPGLDGTCGDDRRLSYGDTSHIGGRPGPRLPAHGVRRARGGRGDEDRDCSAQVGCANRAAGSRASAERLTTGQPDLAQPCSVARRPTSHVRSMDHQASVTGCSRVVACVR